ncbi:MAG TPA: EAL domain-containing protein [Candidatus Angelobacter sp.]|nr:EAL domain-containing protein [Candidatus Angelobacter sp.]
MLTRARPLAPWAFTAMTALLAALLYVRGVAPLAALSAPVDMQWWLIALFIAFAESYAVHIHLRRHAHTMAMAEVPMVLALFFAAPTALVIGRVVGSAVALTLHRRQPPLKLAFNVSMFALETALLVVVFRLCLHDADALSLRACLAVLAATATASVFSAVWVQAVASVASNEWQFRRLPELLPASLAVTVLNSLVGLAAARVLWHDTVSAALALLPVVGLVVFYRRYIEEREKHERIEMLYTSSRAFQRSRGVDATITTLLNRAREMFRADFAELTLLPAVFDGDAARFQLRSDGDVVETLTAADELTALVARRRCGFLMGRGRHHEAWHELVAARGLRDAMLVPISGEAGVLGVLLVADRHSDIATFGREELTLLETFAGQASVSIENGRLEAEMLQLAFHDSLTGLANRALLTQRLEETLERRLRAPLGPAVLFLDLDDFKTVNDSLGHAVGDRLLTLVADRLRGCLRPADTAARLGGDEFAILLEEVRSVVDASAVAERMIAALRAPFTVDGTRVLIHASIGLVIATPDRNSADELLRDADIAMYRAKAQGKGTWELFEPSMQEQVRERHLMKLDLEHALENGELVVHYQPIVALADESIVGVEALVRWVHPRRGMVMPTDFVPLAEETGLINSIGRFVLRRSCAEAAAWSRSAPDFVLTVNLSARQLYRDDFVSEVATVVAETGFDPQRLVLEITESVMVEDDDRVRDALLGLKNLGVRLAIDDFGTGYSSLSSLRELPVDILKIAKPFIDGLGTDGDDGAFAAAIVRLGQTLGLSMIAEGIERTEQLAELRPLLCGMAQGYLFAKPMEGTVFTELLGTLSARRRPADDGVAGDVAGQVVSLFG